MIITIINVTDSESGVRKIPKNHLMTTGRVETLRAGTLFAEGSLERDFGMLLDFNPRVGKTISQPMRIEYKVDGELRCRRYTPDVLVRYRSFGGKPSWRPTVYEVKSRAELARKCHEFLPGFEAARMVCRSRGWNFRVVTDKYIRTEYLENVARLRPYKRYPDNGVHSLMLLRTLEELGTATPAELLAATFMDLERRMEGVGVMWRLIANGSIGTSLSKKLTMNSPIWFVL